jgi:tRNA-splicing ligase RtcB
MKRIINTEKLPILLWLDQIDPEALTQAKNLANHPKTFKHIALMPDCHPGYAMPIGAVLATQDCLLPNAVGVDIGCGMVAVKTNLTRIATPTLKKILGDIRRVVPVGFAHHPHPQNTTLMPRSPLLDDSHSVVFQEYRLALTQIGTLGGGNHFIEIQQAENSLIWVMLHSGSRNIGFRVAHYYQQQARSFSQKYQTQVPPIWQLDYLPLDSSLGQKYLIEMNYCLDFAFANRRLMLDRVQQIIKDHLPSVKYSDFINIAHNYAASETHFAHKLFIHRKGATEALPGNIGIIPGSQGSRSYIIKGLGNLDSFQSCSHGAGRRLGRRQAQRTLDLSAEINRLDHQGILHAIRGTRDLDEAPGAYKDIDQVMANQSDLVAILHSLRPLAVIKA